uniref:SH3 domain and tetratricopeptide repeats 1 n=1 Tax=Sphenodon punctatus TaxID=8508 RepID=A0A8D0G913_SPHPU
GPHDPRGGDHMHLECICTLQARAPSRGAAHELLFFPDISLKLIMVRRKTGLSDSRLQGYLRGRLRLLENESREAAAVFSELSARLLSIYSDQDLIVVTFKTFEEIWKFLTYHSLGFINHCMENLLLDQSFWLCSDEENEDEEAGINVSINKESLNLMYRGLLIQEGKEDSVWSKITVKKSPGLLRILGTVTEGTSCESLSNDSNILSKAASEPLNPFHHSYESAVPTEFSFQNGDKIEIVGFLIECMQWFVGRHVATGKVGFVKTAHVKPQNIDFLGEEENSFFTTERNLLEENVMQLLKETTNTDVCMVCRVAFVLISEMPRSWLKAESSSMEDKVKEFLMRCKDRQFTSEGTDSEEKEASDFSSKETSASSDELCFCIPSGEDAPLLNVLASLLSFLNSEEYEMHFQKLYDFSFTFLNTIFYGYAGEEELVDYFVLAREAAKKENLPWALTRLCFLLGRLSVRKLKFSQARVYFEEALGAIRGGFNDLHLLVALYANLTTIYLKQKNKEKCAYVLDKAASLLMGIPNYICSTELESDILKYALKRTILSRNKHAEARACFLLAKHYASFKKWEEALPFLERLQLLNNDLDLQNSSLSADCYFKLGEFYHKKCLPHIVLSCVKVASSQGSCTLLDSLRSIDLVIKNAPKQFGLRKSRETFPSQIAHYLRQALALETTQEQQKLSSTIYLSLSELYSHHKHYRKAIIYMEKALDTNPSVSAEGTINHLALLAWLHICHGQTSGALAMLNVVVDSLQSNLQQLAVIYNMIAIALKRSNNTKKAAESYYKALHISKEMGMMHNQAVILANFGALCLHSAARNLAEHYLVKAVKLFSGLSSVDCGREFVQVLLRLGYYYANGTHVEKGRIYYEWAFLVAMETNHLESQLQAIQLLCQFYSTILPDEAQCVIYNEYQLSLATKMSNKVLEGKILETISQLYISFGTERAYRSALEYTKRSLGIFIDLQKKRREAYAWLQAGKIYYILRQTELVDLYIQVAQNVALSTGDPNLGMALFEAAGDIFFNGNWEKEKAVTFYRDRALPLAIKTGNRNAELRLCNKLVELLLTLEAYEESLEYAQVSLTLSVNLGKDRLLNERVAYHRLAALHHRLGQCELAEHFYLKALSLCSSPLEFDEETLYYVKVYLILGDIIFYDLKDPFDAAGYYHLALAAAMDLGNKKAQLKIYTRLAIIYHNFLADREMSLFFYQKARAFATDLNVRRINLAPEQCYRSTPPPGHPSGVAR